MISQKSSTRKGKREQNAVKKRHSEEDLTFKSLREKQKKEAKEEKEKNERKKRFIQLSAVALISVLLGVLTGVPLGEKSSKKTTKQLTESGDNAFARRNYESALEAYFEEYAISGTFSSREKIKTTAKIISEIENGYRSLAQLVDRHEYSAAYLQFENLQKIRPNQPLQSRLREDSTFHASFFDLNSTSLQYHRNHYRHLFAHWYENSGHTNRPYFIGLDLYTFYEQFSGRNRPALAPNQIIGQAGVDFAPLCEWTGKTLFAAPANPDHYQSRTAGFQFYNKNLVTWLHQHLIPFPLFKQADGLVYQELYDWFYQKTMRSVAREYLYFQTDEGQLKSTATRYYAEVNAGKDGISWLRDEFEGGQGEILSNPTILRGFWLRRQIDGTADACWEGVVKVMRLYDNNWFEGEIGKLPREINIPEPDWQRDWYFQSVPGSVPI